MKHRLLILTTIVLSALQLQAQGIRYDDDPVDLESLYQQIDNAILQSPRYVAERERQITACSDSLVQAVTPEQRLPLAERLFQLYIPVVDYWALYDNSTVPSAKIACGWKDQRVNVVDETRYIDLSATYKIPESHE